MSKVSYLDSTLLFTSTQAVSAESLYTPVMHDMAVHVSSAVLPLSTLLNSEFQDIFSVTLITSPELLIALSDFTSLYILTSSVDNAPAAITDSYTSNLNFFVIEGAVSFMLFFYYVWFLVYFVVITVSLK